MSNATTAWYQAPTGAHGFGRGLGELTDPVTVAAMLAHPQTRARVTREQWRFLWDHYGLEELLALTQGGEDEAWRRGEMADRPAAVRGLIDSARRAGYDPVSGFLGTYSAQTRTFEIAPVQ